MADPFARCDAYVQKARLVDKRLDMLSENGQQSVRNPHRNLLICSSLYLLTFVSMLLISLRDLIGPLTGERWLPSVSVIVSQLKYVAALNDVTLP